MTHKEPESPKIIKKLNSCLFHTLIKSNDYVLISTFYSIIGELSLLYARLYPTFGSKKGHVLWSYPAGCFV